MSTLAAPGWRLLPLETWPRWQALVATPIGQIALALAATLATCSFLAPWEASFAVAAALLVARSRAKRPLLLFLLSWSFAWLEIALGGNDTLDVLAPLTTAVDLPPLAVASGSLVLTLLGCATALRHVRRRPQSLLARRPLTTLLAMEATLVGLACTGLLPPLAHSLVWALILVVTPYLWFLPFALADQRARDATPFLGQLGLQRPFWSPTYLPFGKGAAFLRKFEARTPEALQVAQLKGLKLLLWANLLLGIREALGKLGHDVLGLPELPSAVDAFLAGHAHPLPVAWAALGLSAVMFCLQVATWAHCFIGLARLAGYALPRGSWRPLESRTLMDYFNRFHYYFKELLVDLFFVPTFFRYFKGRPQLRMFFATFMAAGVGNALWHFLRDIYLVASHGLGWAVTSYTSYLFYCGVLATGIGLSQVRASQGKRPGNSALARTGSFLFVWSFVILLHVFSDGSREHSLTERLQFLAHLFGVLS